MNEIPAGWEALTVGDLLARRPKNGTSPVAADHFAGAYILGLGCLTKQGFAPTQLKNAPPWRTTWSASQVHAGDLLITRANTRDLVGMIGRYRDVGVRCIYPDLMMKLSPNSRVLPAFLEHLLRSDSTRRQIQSSASGTSESMVKITASIVMSLRVNIPPLVVQRKIAEVLEAVDESIRTTERLIAKLGSIKAATLTSLISGVDDQLFRPLDSALARVDAGKSPDAPDRSAGGSEWGVLKVSAVRTWGFDEAENKVLTNPGSIDPRFEVHAGDLLITRANTPQLVGLACYVYTTRPRLLLSDKTLRLVADRDVADPRYLNYVLASPNARRQIEVSGTGSSGSMKNISQREIRSIRIPLPDVVEQERIVNIIECAEQVVADERAELAKLRKVKQGLMEDLLTGRVRVNVG